MSENISLDEDSRRRTVYVVYGHDTDTIHKINALLKDLGLKFLKKEEAVGLTKETAPFIGRVIDSAFEYAQAVIVLLTGDEEVQLCNEFQHYDDEYFERVFYPQPTQEQIFEAGYAFGKSPERTILIQIGHVRPFSDIVGRYILHFSEVLEDHALLRTRLQRAGCIIEEV
jgi:predicted nucleotide-binding protein